MENTLVQNTEEMLDKQMPSQMIGKVNVSYNKNSNILYTTFIPAFHITERVKTAPELMLPDCKGREDIVRNSILEAMASWFSKSTDIEIADREKYKIDIRTEFSKNFPDGSFKVGQYEVFIVPLEEEEKEA